MPLISSRSAILGAESSNAGYSEGDMSERNQAAPEVSISGRLNHIQGEAQLRKEVIKQKIEQQNRLVEQSEAEEASQKDKEVAVFQLNVLLSLRRRNLEIMGEQV